MSQRRGFLLGFGVCLLGFLPLLNLGSCADDLTGPRGQDAVATPNISVRGGGTITWSSETGQISFTENIVIRDHSLGSVYTITPTASPITLSQVNDISYVEVVRDVALEEEITETRQVESGSIDVQAVNAVAVTLFERSEEGVVYIPWVQKELVTGDEWRFGTALSWFENKASQSKPAYYSAHSGSSGTAISLPASMNTPSVVRIAGKIYGNVEPYSIDFSGNGSDGDGRGGLEPGEAFESNSVYYLYAVPSDAGRTFDIVASSNPPSSGPETFSLWSYVGACATRKATAAFHEFRAANGILVSEDEIELFSHNTDAAVAHTFNSLPSTATKAWVRATLEAAGSGGTGRVAGIDDQGHNPLILSGPDGASQTIYQVGWVPIFETGKLYVINNNTGNTIYAIIQGWQEDPMAYK